MGKTIPVVQVWLMLRTGPSFPIPHSALHVSVLETALAFLREQLVGCLEDGKVKSPDFTEHFSRLFLVVHMNCSIAVINHL